jgi:uncharacterized cofD-like protein
MMEAIVTRELASVRGSATTSASPPAVVAFGGGHGLAASLTALRRVTPRLTAVVTVADDGGSSGRLRDELGALPPGDLRMALAALAASDGRSEMWADAFQHRFGGPGPLAGHPLGNLVLTALTEQLDDPVSALDAAAQLLGCCGRVLPLSLDPVDIVAQVSYPGRRGEREEVHGQVAVASTKGRVEAVELVPVDPTPCAQALEAVDEADVLVLGPGSFFTSVLPHLLAPTMAKSIVASAARRVLVLNLEAQPGETEGFAPHTHLEELSRLIPALRLDAVIADPGVVPDTNTLRKAAESLGANLLLAPVAIADEPRHDPAALAEAFVVAFGQSKRGQAG